MSGRPVAPLLLALRPNVGARPRRGGLGVSACAIVTILAVAACGVEPRPGPSIPIDASTADAGVADTGTSTRAELCTPGSDVCGADRYCSQAGVCRARGAACGASSACPVGQACFGATCADTSCARGARACASAEDHCSIAGSCGPPLADDGTLRARCVTAADCGPGGLCFEGACVACSIDQRCAAPLVCGADGRCAEPSPCAGDASCLPGNRCVAGVCTPPTDACVDRADADRSAGALPLVDNATVASVCGRDVDWWGLDTPGGLGLRVAVEADRRTLDLEVELFVANSTTGGGAVRFTGGSRLVLPGHFVAEIPPRFADGLAQRLLLRVASRGRNGAYRVSARTLPSLCAGDALDLYGDDAREDAPSAPAGTFAARTACPNDVDWTRARPDVGDTWRLAARLRESDGVVTGRLLDDATGAVLAGPLAFTRGMSASIEPAAARGGERWALELRATSAPTAGQPYDLELSRIAGTRYAACRDAPALAPGATRIDADGTELSPWRCPIDGVSGEDRVYRVVPPRVGAVLRLEARAIGQGRVGLGLARVCEDDATIGACASSGADVGVAAAIEHVATSTAPLSVWLTIADGPRPAGVELRVAWDEPGDYTCRLGGATPLVQSGVRTVDVRGGTDTVALAGGDACATTGDETPGPDRFFALSLAADERAVLTLAGPTGGVLWASTRCDALASSCVGAAATEPGRPATLLLRPSTSTNYLVVVDSTSPVDAAPYRLEVRVAPECVTDGECAAGRACDDYVCRGAPANDRCDGEVVTLVDGRATIRGSTGAADDSFASGVCTSPSSVADVVYAVDVPAGTTRFVARVVDATWDPLLVVRRGTCGSAPAEVACNDDRTDGDLLPEVALAQPVADRYYVIVDGYAGRGPFTLELVAER